MRVEPPAGARLAFRPVSFREPLAKYHESEWCRHSEHVILSRERDTVRCQVAGKAESDHGQYGGIKVEVEGLRALQVDIALVSSANVEAVYIDGLDAAGRRLVRWRWAVSGKAASATYTLAPGESKGLFKASDCETPEAVRAVHVFIKLRSSDTVTSFVLRKLAIAS